ncbi:hypothetical protein ACFHYQ_04980 [Sphaerimonospora cavernae]|uniref:Uncharacterized protein n=1 Tax=Sphaerimonospora cavernae TaxID=1740611 RepID=A0ABV6TZQ0_9ACTN
MSTGQIPYLLGYHEIAHLFRVARDAPLQWRKRTLLREPDTVISGSPYWLLPTVLALVKPGQREVDEHRLADYKAGIPGGYVAHVLEEPPPLIGLQEVSWIFDKTSSVIGQWRNRGTLPDPDLVLSGSPLWKVEKILADAEMRGRSVFPGAIARIRAGERAQPKSRQPRRPDTEQQGVLPAERIFTSEQSVAATTYVRSVLNAGHAVEIRPRPSDWAVPTPEDPPERDSLDDANQ